MTELAGSTGTSAVGGATTVGVGGGASSRTASGGTAAAGPTVSLSAWLVDAGLTGSGTDGGSTGTGATAGIAGLAGTVPNGGASLLGRLLTGGELPLHGHLDDPGGGVIDYARLLVSTTAPAGPVTPSDAFWLNPTEVA
jgi:hypothetical protein